jgi:hypothetical protein
MSGKMEGSSEQGQGEAAKGPQHQAQLLAALGGSHLTSYMGKVVPGWEQRPKVSVGQCYNGFSCSRASLTCTMASLKEIARWRRSPRRELDSKVLDEHGPAG